MSAVVSYFVLEVLVMAGLAFWVARLCLVNVSFWNALVAGGIASCFSFLPWVGWLLGSFAFAYVLQLKTREPWMDCLWITILSRPVAWCVTFGLSTLFTSF